MTYPDIETRADYRRYCRAVARGLQGLDAVSVGAAPRCEECGLEHVPYYDASPVECELAGECAFDASPCDVCSRDLAGSHHAAHALIDGEPIHLWICIDCLHFIAYGRLDDLTMLEIEEE